MSFTGNMYEDSEKHKQRVQRLAKSPQNRECADCDAKSPGWCSWNLGVFICIKCAGIHRKLGTHISQVRSATLDKWTLQQAQNMERVGGNVRANQYYERNKPDNIRKPSESDDFATKERYIRLKYEKKAWVDPNSDLYGDNSNSDSNSSPSTTTTSPQSTSTALQNPKATQKPSIASSNTSSNASSNNMQSLIEFDTPTQNSGKNTVDLFDIVSNPKAQVPSANPVRSQPQAQARPAQVAPQPNPQLVNQQVRNPQAGNTPNDLLIDDSSDRNMKKESIMDLFNNVTSAPNPSYNYPGFYNGMQGGIAPMNRAPMMNQPMMGQPMMNQPMMNQPMMQPNMAMNRPMGQPMMQPMMGQPMMQPMMNQPMNQPMRPPMMGQPMVGQPMMNQPNGMRPPMQNVGYRF